MWDVNHAAAASAMAGGAGGGAGDMSGVWRVGTDSPFLSHTGSVEDIQWSPNEATVFASCGTDGTIRIWDTRAPGKSMLHVKGSDVDVNVISWSPLVSFLLASGDDAGVFKVWDLRTFTTTATPYDTFAWHKGAVTSIEWAPDDENVLLAASSDNTVTLWDLSLEPDEEAEIMMLRGEGAPDAAAAAGGAATGGAAASSSSSAGAAAAASAKGGKSKSLKAAAAAAAAAGAVPSTKDEKMAGIRPQMLFIHAGQEDVKEAHFHPQLPGVVITTAADGFNVFKPDVWVTT